MRNRLLLLGALLSCAALGYALGLHSYLAPDRMRELVESAGVFGPLLVVLLFTLLQPFGVPGALFLLVIVSLWPFEIALVINFAGAFGAGMAGFAFARVLGRETAATRMPAQLREWDERLSQRGLPVVVGFRLMFFLNPASHWALGLSQVATPTALLGTALGFAPWVVVWTWFGDRILAWLESLSVGNAVAAAGLIVVGVALWRYRARAKSVAAE